MFLEDEYFERLKIARKMPEAKFHHAKTEGYSKEAVLKVAKPENLNVPLAGYRTKMALDYIARNGELELENQLGEKVTANEVYQEWKVDYDGRKNGADATHLIFSINEKATKRNLNALRESVRDTLAEKFSEYKYAFVIHTDTEHPHVHVMLNNYNQVEMQRNGKPKKLRLDRKLFHETRATFAKNLRRRGLDYVATKKKYKERGANLEYQWITDLYIKPNLEELKNYRSDISENLYNDIKTKLERIDRNLKGYTPSLTLEDASYLGLDPEKLPKGEDKEIVYDIYNIDKEFKNYLIAEAEKLDTADKEKLLRVANFDSISASFFDNLGLNIDEKYNRLVEEKTILTPTVDLTKLDKDQPLETIKAKWIDRVELYHIQEMISTLHIHANLELLETYKEQVDEKLYTGIKNKLERIDKKLNSNNPFLTLDDASYIGLDPEKLPKGEDREITYNVYDLTAGKELRDYLITEAEKLKDEDKEKLLWRLKQDTISTSAIENYGIEVDEKFNKFVKEEKLTTPTVDLTKLDKDQPLETIKAKWIDRVELKEIQSILIDSHIRSNLARLETYKGKIDEKIYTGIKNKLERIDKKLNSNNPLLSHSDASYIGLDPTNLPRGKDREISYNIYDLKENEEFREYLSKEAEKLEGENKDKLKGMLEFSTITVSHIEDFGIKIDEKYNELIKEKKVTVPTVDLIKLDKHQAIEQSKKSQWIERIELKEIQSILIDSHIRSNLARLETYKGKIDEKIYTGIKNKLERIDKKLNSNNPLLSHSDASYIGLDPEKLPQGEERTIKFNTYNLKDYAELRQYLMAEAQEENATIKTVNLAKLDKDQPLETIKAKWIDRVEKSRENFKKKKEQEKQKDKSRSL